MKTIRALRKEPSWAQYALALRVGASAGRLSPGKRPVDAPRDADSRTWPDL